MSYRNTDSPVTERRREQNRIAQRKFRERHRMREADRQPPSTDQPPQRNKRNRGHGDGSVSPTLSGSTEIATGAETSLSLSQVPNLVSMDDTINFVDLEDFSLPDMQSALETTVPEPRENVIDYFESSGFKPPAGNPPVELTSGSIESKSPLHMAVLKGSRKIVQLLLQHGADCNARDNQGLTPLIHAIIEEQDDIVGILLSHGAQIQIVDNYQRSPLHWTVLKRQDRLLRALIKQCEQNVEIINTYDIEGRTPLHIAINLGWDAAVEILLEAGADVGAPTKMLASSG